MKKVQSTRISGSEPGVESEQKHTVDSSLLVLVVDDEEGLREVIQDGITFAGYRHAGASGGIEALELLKSQSFSHLITDIRMPAGDGITLLREAKRIFPNLPVLVITGFSDYTHEDLKKMGATDVLEKPFKMDRLLAFIKSNQAA